MPCGCNSKKKPIKPSKPTKETFTTNKAGNSSYCVASPYSSSDGSTRFLLKDAYKN